MAPVCRAILFWRLHHSCCRPCRDKVRPSYRRSIAGVPGDISGKRNAHRETRERKKTKPRTPRRSTRQTGSSCRCGRCGDWNPRAADFRLACVATFTPARRVVQHSFRNGGMAWHIGADLVDPEALSFGYKGRNSIKESMRRVGPHAALWAYFSTQILPSVLTQVAEHLEYQKVK
jgi:hypothetical protein